MKLVSYVLYRFRYLYFNCIRAKMPFPLNFSNNILDQNGVGHSKRVRTWKNSFSAITRLCTEFHRFPRIATEFPSINKSRMCRIPI